MQPAEVWRLRHAERALELREKERQALNAQRNSERDERQEAHKIRRETYALQERQRKLDVIQKKILLSARLRAQHQRVTSQNTGSATIRHSNQKNQLCVESAPSSPIRSAPIPRSKYDRLLGSHHAVLHGAARAVHLNPGEFTELAASETLRRATESETVIVAPSALSGLSRPPVHWQ